MLLPLSNMFPSMCYTFFHPFLVTSCRTSYLPLFCNAWSSSSSPLLVPFSSSCLLKVYLCYIRPLLEYGCSSFVGLSVCSARQLEAVLQKALSICSVDSACFPSLSERRSSVSLGLFFSILDDNVPDHLSGFCHCHFLHTTQFICHSPSTPSHIPVSVLSSLPRCFRLQLFYYKHLSWISVYLYSLLLY